MSALMSISVGGQPYNQITLGLPFQVLLRIDDSSRRKRSEAGLVERKAVVPLLFDPALFWRHDFGQAKRE
ncbi:hypothetical protein [Bradyrhizobium ivorense]|uniref:hypothetical protein n=1 Tax=Bradyrhizobium ivorense TaxID=2511166 RepID=UPI00111648E6|nr:hypothetical protein [Bradyrhizobium ivorense]